MQVVFYTRTVKAFAAIHPKQRAVMDEVPPGVYRAYENDRHDQIADYLAKLSPQGQSALQTARERTLASFNLDDTVKEVGSKDREFAAGNGVTSRTAWTEEI